MYSGTMARRSEYSGSLVGGDKTSVVQKGHWYRTLALQHFRATTYSVVTTEGTFCKLEGSVPAALASRTHFSRRSRKVGSRHLMQMRWKQISSLYRHRISKRDMPTQPRARSHIYVWGHRTAKLTVQSSEVVAAKLSLSMSIRSGQTGIQVVP